MVKAIGRVALLSMVASIAMYAASTAGCKGCHGQNFEKKALGKSKVVKDMSKDDIVNALKGYKAGTYGGPMKGMMVGQVKALSDADMEAMASEIKGGGAAAPKDSAAAPAAAAATASSEAPAPKGVKEVANEGQYSAPDLTKAVDEKELGLRKTSLFDENSKPIDNKFDAPAPGTSQRLARSYVNAPPLIPHSVEGLLPITGKNNQCLGCHMPDVAKGVGAIAIPKSHFTDFRPTTKMDGDEVVKEGKVLGQANTSDILIAKFKTLKDLSKARFNCSQCHVPQANVKPLVKNNFKPEFKDDKQKSSSNLLDVINQGVK